MEEYEVLALGFSRKEIDTIENHFFCSLTLENWEEIQLFENKEALFKYLYTDNEEIEKAIANIVEEISSITAKNLSESETVLDFLIEQDDNLELPSGRWVVFNQELIRKDQLSQID